jgi:hypothetical protein
VTVTARSPAAAASVWLAGYRAARTRFPPRPAAAGWPATRVSRDQVEDLPGGAPAGRHQAGRGLLLDWLQDQDGDSWQQRWLASGAEEAGPAWWQLPARRAGSRDLPGMRRSGALTAALIAVIAGDVVRPSLAWLVRAGCDVELARAMAAFRDPQGLRAARGPVRARAWRPGAGSHPQPYGAAGRGDRGRQRRHARRHRGRRPAGAAGHRGRRARRRPGRGRGLLPAASPAGDLRPGSAPAGCGNCAPRASGPRRR